MCVHLSGVHNTESGRKRLRDLAIGPFAAALTSSNNNSSKQQFVARKIIVVWFVMKLRLLTIKAKAGADAVQPSETLVYSIVPVALRAA